MVLVNIIVFLISLSLVIILHELGHFIMARRAGILCHEFAIGMGPVLWKKKVGETTYLVKLIPIGGYVMMSGEEIEDQLVKVGSTVRLEFEDNKVRRIVVDHKLEKFENLEKVVVERIDLQGKDGTPLYINDYEVYRDAFYVMKNREMQIAPHDRGFGGKTLLERFLAIFAGPAMNFILAFFVFFLVNLIVGFPNMDSTEIGIIGEDLPASSVLEVNDVIVSIEGVDVDTWDELSAELDKNYTSRLIEVVVERDGVTETIQITPMLYFYSIGFHSSESAGEDLIIGSVPEGTKAFNAGFEEGDQIVSIDGNSVTSWEDVIAEVTVIGQEAYDENRVVTFEVERDGSVVELDVDQPFSEAFLNSQGLDLVESRIGISPTFQFSFGNSFVNSFSDVGNAGGMIFTTLGLLFDNSGAGAGIGVDSLAGPLGIYQITSAALANGFVSLLSWVGLLSVNLGIINLLPLPALDGGRIVFLGYELVTRRKPNRKFENTLNYVVFLLLMGLFVFITFNDVLRLFNLR